MLVSCLHVLSVFFMCHQDRLMAGQTDTRLIYTSSWAFGLTEHSVHAPAMLIFTRQRVNLNILVVLSCLGVSVKLFETVCSQPTEMQLSTNILMFRSSLGRSEPLNSTYHPLREPTVRKTVKLSDRGGVVKIPI